jgi:hypothetical protein
MVMEVIEDPPEARDRAQEGSLALNEKSRPKLEHA